MRTLAFVATLLACGQVVIDGAADPKGDWCAAHGFANGRPELADPVCTPPARPVYGRCSANPNS